MSSKIKDGLFMGDVDAAQDAEFLQLNGITHIINCVPREVPNVFQQSLGLVYTACDLGEVLQRPFFDLQSREFMGLIQAIDRSLERTDSVLVHSMDGLCRSPSVMIGYLMVKYCWGLDKAHEFVAMKRADIKLHESYIQQLTALEGQIQKSFPARATEQQLYEWTLRAADPKSDESVLVHTFLNSAAAANDPHGDTPRHLPLKKVPSQRRITWIDQSSDLVRTVAVIGASGRRKLALMSRFVSL
jgi:protein-tyrosine phosphatase